MKIIFYATLSVFEDMLAQIMDLATIERKKGNTIYFVCCDSSINYCSMISKPKKNYHACITCQYKQRTLLKDFGIDKENIFFMKNKKYKKSLIPNYDSIEKVNSYQYKGVNIGTGVVSTLISYTRDINVDLNLHKSLFDDIFTTALTVVDNIEEIFEEIQPNKVYFYNGRLVEYKTVLEYCKYKSIPFVTYEVGSIITKYTLYENTLPHDPQYNARKAIELAEQNKEEVKKQGEDWYIKRRQGKIPEEKIDINYTKKQEKNVLPSSFDSNEKKGKVIISIFNSSEDEIIAVGQDIWKTYGHQSHITEELLTAFEKSDSNYFFYLRIHPNQANLLHTREVQNLFALEKKFSNLEVIPPDDRVDTYALIKRSKKILSFGSTVGIEATFWGKVSIVYGTSFFKYITDSAYFPDSLEALIQLLKDDNLKPLSKEAAIIYGYYIGERGTDLKYYEYPIFKTENKLESKNSFIYWYLQCYTFFINNRFPMRFFPKKIIYHLFLKK